MSGIIDKSRTAFVLIDIQEKFLPVIHDIDTVIRNADILAKASAVLGVPLVVTEQYPKGLGATTSRIAVPGTARRIEKTHFGCFGEVSFADAIAALSVDTLVLFGIEAHVCVLKTALEARARGMNVHVAADAVSSRSAENRSLALERMRQSGAFIIPTETVLFQCMEKAGGDVFKAVSALIK